MGWGGEVGESGMFSCLDELIFCVVEGGIVSTKKYGEE